MSNTAEKLAPTLTRAIFDFTVPEEAREWETDPKSFSMQQLTTMQDLDAESAAGGLIGLKLVLERASRAIVIIDGQPADQGKPFIDNWSPQARDLAAIAYKKISLLKPEHVESFLGSMKKRVG